MISCANKILSRSNNILSRQNKLKNKTHMSLPGFRRYMLFGRDIKLSERDKYVVRTRYYVVITT